MDGAFLQAMESTLPWIVVYGNWVWSATLVALMAAAPLHIWLRRRQIARAKKRDAMGELGAPTAIENLHPNRLATLEGIVRVKAGPRDTSAGKAAAVANGRVEDDARAESLSLVCGESEHSLAGPTRLLSGSRWIRGGDEGLYTAIFSGDRVRVRGRVEAIAGGDSGYRDAAGQWRIVGCEENPIDIVADGVQVPAPRGRELPRALLLPVLIFFAATYVAGAMGSETLDDISASAGQVDVPLGLRVASATPFHRDDALDRLGYGIGFYGKGSRTLSMGHVALELLQDDCPAAVKRALEHDEMLLAVELANGCPPTAEGLEARVAANYVVGNFSAISEQLGRFSLIAIDDPWATADGKLRIVWDIAARIHLLAGHYSRAADAVEVAVPRLQALARSQAEDGDGDIAVERTQVKADAIACLGHALRVRGGQESSRSALEAAARTLPICHLLLAEVTPLERRADVLVEFEWSDWRAIIGWDGARFNEMLYAEATGRSMTDQPHWRWTVGANDLMSYWDHGAIYRFALATAALRSFDRVVAAKDAFVRASLVADLAYLKASWRLGESARLAEEALGELRRAEALLAEHEGPTDELLHNIIRARYCLLFLRAAIAGRAGETARAMELRKEGIAAFRQALQLEGDSEAVVQEEVMEKFGPNGEIPPGSLAGPFHREKQIAELLRLGFHSEAETQNPEELRFHTQRPARMELPSLFMRGLFETRELATLVGGTEWQEELDMALDNWWRALSKRDTSVLLAVLEML